MGTDRESNTRSMDRIIAEITKQATTGTAITPTPEEWAKALPKLDGVACEWIMMDSLSRSHLWWEDGDFYATGLGPGLEESEDRPLNRYEAAALLEGTMHEPVDLEEVDA